MTDPVTPLTSPPVVEPAPRSVPVQPPAAATEPAKAAVEAHRRPLTVDVQRDGGVFVYTLRDPATDTVLAVIPREAVRLDRDGRNFDQRV